MYQRLIMQTNKVTPNEESKSCSFLCIAPVHNARYLTMNGQTDSSGIYEGYILDNMIIITKQRVITPKP